MKTLRLNKTELRNQRENLGRYERYLPLLEVKKRQLEQEAERVRSRIREVLLEIGRIREGLEEWLGLMGEDVGLHRLVRLQSVRAETENVAGVDVPAFREAILSRERYDLFLYPLWVDAAVVIVARILVLKAEKMVLDERYRRIMNELRVATQRVNLFERVKIPEARESIHRIHIRLSDQQAAAMGWARMAKRKLSAGRAP